MGPTAVYAIVLFVLALAAAIALMRRRGTAHVSGSVVSTATP
jgi:hypothetical protein